MKKLTDFNNRGFDILMSNIAVIFNVWKKSVLDDLLEVCEIPKIMTFCEHLIKR